VDLKEDFAEYHASYSVKDGVLLTERSLLVKLHEVPINEYEVYKKFNKAVSDDHELYIEMSSNGAVSNPLQRLIGNLPASDNVEAMNAYSDALAEIRDGSVSKAVDSLDGALKVDPHFARAWMLLAQVYATSGNRSMAIQTLEKANDADPHQPAIYKSLVASLLGEHEYAKAVSVLQEVIKDEPSNTEALSNMGKALFSLKRYGEAATVLQSAIAEEPKRAALYGQLGSIYLRADDDAQALVAYRKALELDPQSMSFNDVAYTMADANKQLPIALQYAEKAVREEEEASANAHLSDLKAEDLRYSSSLSAFWDTLGWVYFRMGKFDLAEKYLNAAWTLSQSGVVGDHLGQVYEQEHKKEAAVHMYRLALSAAPSATAVGAFITDLRAKINRLGGNGDAALYKEAEELTRLRTTKLARLVSGQANAEFFIQFTPGAKAKDVKFISGSEKLQSANKVLTSTNFTVPFPDDGHASLVRRGILSCYPASGCSFVMLNPADVHSVN
jgi:tetratricopeptide (TPR) repeat protein